MLFLKSAIWNRLWIKIWGYSFWSLFWRFSQKIVKSICASQQHRRQVLCCLFLNLWMLAERRCVFNNRFFLKQGQAPVKKYHLHGINKILPNTILKIKYFKHGYFFTIFLKDIPFPIMLTLTNAISYNHLKWAQKQQKSMQK